MNLVINAQLHRAQQSASLILISQNCLYPAALPQTGLKFRSFHTDSFSRYSWQFPQLSLHTSSGHVLTACKAPVSPTNPASPDLAR